MGTAEPHLKEEQCHLVIPGKGFSVPKAAGSECPECKVLPSCTVALTLHPLLRHWLTWHKGCAQLLCSFTAGFVLWPAGGVQTRSAVVFSLPSPFPGLIFTCAAGCPPICAAWPCLLPFHPLLCCWPPGTLVGRQWPSERAVTFWAALACLLGAPSLGLRARTCSPLLLFPQ